MKCGDCGFEGAGEVGSFGIDTERLYMAHLRCPKCKSRNIDYYESIDEIRIALRYPSTCSRNGHAPTKNVVQFVMGGCPDLVGYSIHCPLCHWGSSSAISRAEYDKLLKERKALVTLDAETELKKLGVL